jgi:uncharacterized protein
VKILNTTKNTVLAEHVVIADRLFTRAKGLLGVADFKQGQALVIKPCNSIHTCFMAFPIDVLFVDKDYRVIKVFPFLRPFRFTPLYFKSSLVIELPSGTLQSTSTSLGDILIIK